MSSLAHGPLPERPTSTPETDFTPEQQEVRRRFIGHMATAGLTNILEVERIERDVAVLETPEIEERFQHFYDLLAFAHATYKAVDYPAGSRGLFAPNERILHYTHMGMDKDQIIAADSEIGSARRFSARRQSLIHFLLQAAGRHNMLPAEPEAPDIFYVEDTTELPPEPMPDTDPPAASAPDILAEEPTTAPDLHDDRNEWIGIVRPRIRRRAQRRPQRIIGHDDFARPAGDRALPDQPGSPIQPQQLRELLHACGISDRNTRVVLARYDAGELVSFKDLQARFGVTPQRLQQIVASSLRHLASRDADGQLTRQLQDMFYPGYASQEDRDLAAKDRRIERKGSSTKATKEPYLTREDEQQLAKDIEAGLYAEHLLVTAQDTGAELDPQMLDDLGELQGIGEKAYKRFLAANTDLVGYALWRRRSKIRAWGIREPRDLKAEVIAMGLPRAIQGFDYTRGNRFSTYALWWLDSAIEQVAVARQLVTINRRMFQQIMQVRREESALAIQLGRTPTEAEIAAVLDIQPARVNKLKRIYNERILTRHLNQKIKAKSSSSSSDETSEYIDYLQADGPTPEESFIDTENEALLGDALSHLPEDQRIVLGHTFGLNGVAIAKDADVAEQLNIPVGRVRKLRADALKALRQTLADEE